MWPTEAEKQRLIETWQDAWSKRANARGAASELIRWCNRRVWSVFYTQTFRRRTSLAGARAIWCSYLADTLSYSAAIRAALWVAEPHPTAPERYHVHALLSLRSTEQSWITEMLSCISQRRPSKHSNWWRQYYRSLKSTAWRRLGAARLWPITSGECATVWYVLKYVTKTLRAEISHPERRPTHQIDWDIWTAHTASERRAPCPRHPAS